MIDISSDDEDDDQDEKSRDAGDDSISDSDKDDGDPENSGSHVNDAMNQPDEQGRVLVNVGHPPNEHDIFLAPQLAANVKPHQVSRTLWLWTYCYVVK